MDDVNELKLSYKPAESSAEANWTSFKSKLLICLTKVVWFEIDNW